MTNTPLSVLDLVPIPSGATAGDALRNTADLAVRAEDLGYARYWVAEHHLNPGVAGTSPAVVLGLVAAATSRIRIGSGAVQMGHRTALSVVEEFGLLDALHPGRIDLGLGRSGGRPPDRSPGPVLVGAGAPAGRASSGLRIPAPFSFLRLLGSPRFAVQKQLLMLPGASAQDYSEQIDDVLALIAGTYRGAEGAEAHVVPGEGAALQLWVLGSSGGTSAITAGQRGMRFAANYHVSPSSVLSAVDAYRDAFQPSPDLAHPHVCVSADVVVGDDDTAGRRLAAGYGRWVHSIRSGAGAIPFPSPEEADAAPLTPSELELVTDRIETQFVGSPATVADGLEQLRAATDADEILVTTITHDHADRVRSYELLAAEWGRRGFVGARQTEAATALA